MRAQKVVVLTGGLGNQLFQLAAGLYISSPDQLIIEGRLGRPRLNSLKRPDLDSFEFPFTLHYVCSPRASWLPYYMTSILFKISSKSFDSNVIQWFWLLLKSCALRGGVFVSNGVGFDPRLVANVEAKWIFGPFHCFRFLDSPEVSTIIRPMRPRIYPTWLKDLKEVSKTEKPIVLHLRLSDYKDIPELGILTKSYYKTSLTMAMKDFPSSRIWLFTDEEHLALQLLEDFDCKEMRIINYDSADSAANLEAMRFGECFILSNSTFSWWGATLAYSPNAKIICPENWFKTKENPKDLIPQNWIKVKNR